MDFIAEHHLDDVLGRDVTFGEVPDVLWTTGTTLAPVDPQWTQRRAAQARAPAGRPGPLPRRAHGFAVVAVDAPVHGDRPRSDAENRARAELHRTMAAGEPPESAVAALVDPIVERAVPQWRSVIDPLLGR